MINRITKSALLLVLAGSLQTGLAAPASAQEIGVAEGLLCGFISEYDPTVEGPIQVGEMDGGPLAATAPGATIDLKCTIQVGAANSTHSGADSVSASSGPMLQVASVPPTIIHYAASPGQPVYLCTQATINGVVHYFDDLSGLWSTSSASTCGEAISQETYPKGGPCSEEAVVHIWCTIPDGSGARCWVWLGMPPGSLPPPGFCLVAGDDR